MPQTILVVDDDESILQVVEIVLSEAGYEVIPVKNKREFQASLETTKPDLLLLDIFAADLDGREISKQIKSNEATKHIPVILMSADTHIQEKSINALANDCIEKPFDIDDLLQLVQSYLEQPNSQAA